MFVGSATVRLASILLSLADYLLDLQHHLPDNIKPRDHVGVRRFHIRRSGSFEF